MGPGNEASICALLFYILVAEFVVGKGEEGRREGGEGGRGGRGEEGRREGSSLIPRPDLISHMGPGNWARRGGGVR